MATQNKNDFYQMQRDAERRVMEMQRRAKHTVQNDPPEPPPPPPPMPVPTHRPANRGFLEMLNVRSLLEGKDTSLILMVMAMLGSEQTDPLLMLALLYIMM